MGTLTAALGAYAAIVLATGVTAAARAQSTAQDFRRLGWTVVADAQASSQFGRELLRRKVRFGHRVTRTELTRSTAFPEILRRLGWPVALIQRLTDGRADNEELNFILISTQNDVLVNVATGRGAGFQVPSMLGRRGTYFIFTAMKHFPRQLADDLRRLAPRRGR